MTRFIALLFTLMGTCAAAATEQPGRVGQPGSEQQYNASLVDSLLAGEFADDPYGCCQAMR